MNTIPDRLDHFLQAPSKVKLKEACAIANHIFRPCKFLETGALADLLSSTPYQKGPAPTDAVTDAEKEPELTDAVTSAEAVLSAVCDYLEKILYLNTKEPSGYGLLSIFMIFFTKHLSTLGREYKADLQFVVADNSLQGGNPCCDAELVAILVDHLFLHSLYEYKPAVHPDLTHVSPETILELDFSAIMP